MQNNSEKKKKKKKKKIQSYRTDDKPVKGSDQLSDQSLHFSILRLMDTLSGEANVKFISIPSEKYLL